MTSAASSSASWAPASLPLPARELLVDALELRDIVVLLSCSRELRRDHETATLAMQRQAVTCHFGRGCTLDWCAATPAYLLSDDEQQASCNANHTGEPILSLADADGEDGVQLLSLAGLMGNALSDVLYHSIAVDTLIYTPLPFLSSTKHQPTSQTDKKEASESETLADQLDCIRLATEMESDSQTRLAQPPSVSPTPFALHFENVEVAPLDPHDAHCAFCDMVDDRVDVYMLDAFEYMMNRDMRVTEAIEDLQEAGYDEDSDEWAATVAHFERFDQLFDDDLIDEEDAPRILRQLIAFDKLPALRGMERLAEVERERINGEEEVARAVCEAAHADFVNRACVRLCVAVRHFFVANGFRDIRHETMENRNFGLVEKVTAVAPSGFVAGMVIVAGEGVGIVQ